LGAVEANYIQAEQSQTGNVIKGFDNYLFSKEALRKRARLSDKKDDVPKPLFSLSSKSSAVTREENSMMEQ
jgi:chromatin modification-related protein EAF6